MRIVISRVTFAVGVFLLLGGWAGMRYADEQQQAARPSPSSAKMNWWTSGTYRDDVMPSRDIMAVSGAALATGGLLAALSAPWVVADLARAPARRGAAEGRG